MSAPKQNSELTWTEMGAIAAVIVVVVLWLGWDSIAPHLDHLAAWWDLQRAEWWRLVHARF